MSNPTLSSLPNDILKEILLLLPLCEMKSLLLSFKTNLINNESFWRDRVKKETIQIPLDGTNWKRFFFHYVDWERLRYGLMTTISFNAHNTKGGYFDQNIWIAFHKVPNIRWFHIYKIVEIYYELSSDFAFVCISKYCVVDKEALYDDTLTYRYVGSAIPRVV